MFTFLIDGGKHINEPITTTTESDYDDPDDNDDRESKFNAFILAIHKNQCESSVSLTQNCVTARTNRLNESIMSQFVSVVTHFMC